MFKVSLYKILTPQTQAEWIANITKPGSFTTNIPKASRPTVRVFYHALMADLRAILGDKLDNYDVGLYINPTSETQTSDFLTDPEQIIEPSDEIAVVKLKKGVKIFDMGGRSRSRRGIKRSRSRTSVKRSRSRSRKSVKRLRSRSRRGVKRSRSRSRKSVKRSRSRSCKSVKRSRSRSCKSVKRSRSRSRR
jgi:hypothetical protein